MCTQQKGGIMKRIITFIILGHWFLFFMLHSLGALAGSLIFATTPGLSNLIAAFGAGGAIAAMPLVSAGMGTASLLTATLFFWAFLASLLAVRTKEDDGDVEKIAFGAAAVVFTMLSALAVVNADPSTLLAAMGYFAVLLLSWLATRVEWLEIAFVEGKLTQSSHQAPKSITIARTMASSAAHHNLLAKIARRERN
jgi:hypothetical protein